MDCPLETWYNKDDIKSSRGENMTQWFQQFFGYFEDANGSLSTFYDGLGEGAYGWRHIVWIFLVLFFAIGGYFYFKKHPENEKKWVMGLLIALFTVRFSNQTIRAFIGAEVPWTRAFPFHMCTVLTFLLPITYVFHLKKI